MIAVRVEGKLGNQLFQYAFIYAAARKLGTKFYIDKSVDHFLLDKYFDIEHDFCHTFDQYLFSIRGFKNLFSYHFRYRFYALLKYAFRLKTMTFDNITEPAVQIKLIENNFLYYGFFQSEEYFSWTQWRPLFKIKGKYVAAFEKIRDILELPSKYVVVHIRRGDFLDHGWALEYGYFHKAIASIHNEENFYVFISDEPQIIEVEFNYIKLKYISGNNEIIDFQFLKNADTCILSNSTFSWWGARLNDNDPRIIAPRYWLGLKEKKEIPAGILPANFILIDPFN